MVGKIINKNLLAWYDVDGRDLPWRVKGARHPNPYHVWLSEIMLQQTTVVTVIPYFKKFITRWPDVRDLASADLDEILHAWAGLGYYARARNLHKCAQAVVAHHDGQFPDRYEVLLKLPGIGPYTAAAIAAIAFDHPEAVVDGNIERVISRVFALTAPLPQIKSDIKEKVKALTSSDYPGDFAQSMMDLGAMICTPKNPQCNLCPIQRQCRAFEQGIAHTLPVKPPKKAKPVKRAIVFWLQNPTGAILLRRREEKGLLGGMMEFPSSPWVEDFDENSALQHAPANVNWQPTGLQVKHTFTHFHLYLDVYCAQSTRMEEGIWSSQKNLHTHALPTLMRKVERVMVSNL